MKEWKDNIKFREEKIYENGNSKTSMLSPFLSCYRREGGNVLGSFLPFRKFLIKKVFF